MYDFLGLRLHFKDEFYTTVAVRDGYEFHINFDDLLAKGLKLEAGIVVDSETGLADIENLRHPWESVPTSYAAIAMKVFQGSGFRPSACIELKASPAKIMQGHNVYGSANLVNCLTAFLDSFKRSMPEFSELIDFDNTDIFRFDSTYSVQLESRDQVLGALKSFTSVSHRYLRPSREGEYETSVYFNNDKNSPDTGRSTSLIIYSKMDEVGQQCESLKRLAKKEKTRKYDHIIEQLSDESLRDFATNRLRFEARFLSRWFKKHDIPQNIWEFCKYVEIQELASGESFCAWAWRDANKYLLEAIEGSTLTVVNDHKVMQLLNDLYDTTDDKGNIRQSKAFRLFQLYDRLKHNTYKQVKETMSKSSFHRNINDLMAVGFSKDQLQNLHLDEQVPLCQVIEFDFDNQTPSDYVEPQFEGIQTGADLLAYLKGQTPNNVSVTELDKIEDALQESNLPPFYARALQAGREVRVNKNKSVSFVLWKDGTSNLLFHKPNDRNVRLAKPQNPLDTPSGQKSFQQWSGH
ncbi:phage/plasmid replication protein, II/X family [Vibrio cyclitrophicus]|uniref:phage/plasmid replication protein, II/X family n=1 Tax=Vibrio cyclitrophicus TaxID=47951 RepID=UPI0002DABA67|nr:phage/plasmid replication protein, II/X family [Vibrio cyclitrophicus]OEE16672.1 replication protein [Vibrio cyclitrophicus ZF207]